VPAAWTSPGPSPASGTILQNPPDEADKAGGEVARSAISGSPHRVRRIGSAVLAGPGRAARLLGAAHRQAGGWEPLVRDLSPQIARRLEPLRQREPAHWRAGAELDPDEAYRLALTDDEPPGRRPGGAP
jgi:hypothetical protein